MEFHRFLDPVYLPDPPAEPRRDWDCGFLFAGGQLCKHFPARRAKAGRDLPSVALAKEGAGDAGDRKEAQEDSNDEHR
jgi:hypothetical protein